MENSVIEKYRKAGKINFEAGEYAKSIIKPGMSLLELGDKIEAFIIKEGGKIAFPVNLSLDECAAHYSPSINDTSTLPDEGLLKVDIGVHVDGYISDHAITVNIGGNGGLYRKLVESSEKALETAIKNFKPGVNVVEIGKMIEETIREKGFTPVSNLGGHSMERYNLHSGTFIPNVGSGSPAIVREGDVYAIEPFSTNGKGFVIDGTKKLIYRFIKKPRRKLNMKLDSVLNVIRKNFNGLPFSPRWLEKKYASDTIMPMITRLEQIGSLHGYNLLIEFGNGLVSQAEHTVIVTEDGAEVTTSQ
ncbi:MAG: type II methionyl aminopeptidase [Promethearchaeota archaeon]